MILVGEYIFMFPEPACYKCFRCINGLVYPMLPVSLVCPFLIVPSVFSNVYMEIKI
jgi:hypothetical protein